MDAGEEEPPSPGTAEPQNEADDTAATASDAEKAAPPMTASTEDEPTREKTMPAEEKESEKDSSTIAAEKVQVRQFRYTVT